MFDLEPATRALTDVVGVVRDLGLPAGIAGVIALNEVTVHGGDNAVALDGPRPGVAGGGYPCPI
ncbi:MAG: hypothetical protein ACHQNA_02060 [Acidimicrobiales bacterium]